MVVVTRLSNGYVCALCDCDESGERSLEELSASACPSCFDLERACLTPHLPDVTAR
jgi:hypothetical protein